MTIDQLTAFFSNPVKDNFDTIAEEIINGFQIYKDGSLYSFAEIEFYYYGEDQKDSHTYIRKCKAMDWFFHYSGVDIAFETKYDDKNTPCQFGGVLIRSIIKHVKGEKDEVIAGPLRCQQEIFNGIKELPVIKEKDVRSCHQTGNNLRHGITDDIYKYRHFIIDDDFEWNSSSKRAVYEWKTIDKKKVLKGVCEKIVKTSYNAIPYTDKSGEEDT